jgi:hypothetical protein
LTRDSATYAIPPCQQCTRCTIAFCRVMP